MTELPWRAEAAFLKAWPALTTTAYGGWQARFANGVSRRANSVNPLHADAGLREADIDFFCTAYAAQHLPLIFRVPTLLTSDADRVLERAGFAAEGECLVLHGALDAITAQPDPAVSIDAAASRHWFDASQTLQVRPVTHRQTYEAVIATVTLPSGFAMLRDNDDIVALAYGALDGDLLCLESVVTDPAHRGKGFGQRLIEALSWWAKQRGARNVCLQVEAGNTSALALYRRIGISDELYRYQYRRCPLKRVG